VGVTNTGSVGATKWVNACPVMAYQGAGTFNSGVTQTCSWSNDEVGWIIVEVSYDVLANWSNRGSASVSKGSGGNVTVSSSTFGSKFNGAISLAVSAGDVSAQTSLNAEYQRLLGYSWNFDAPKNTVTASVTANGRLFVPSKIEIQAKAKLRRIY